LQQPLLFKLQPIHGSSTISGNLGNVVTKTNATGWNHLVTLSNPLTRTHSIIIKINKYVSGMFIGLAPKTNKSEAGYFETVGI